MAHLLFVVFGNGHEGILVDIEPNVNQYGHVIIEAFIGSVILTASAHWPKHPAIPLF